ncbi:O-antigen ligase family protein [Pseudarthrobacter sp. NS4]|uniref:O-antigen ligase family protein n=1 Tax=Pseudarthrobacter sp. NS4 TaxID=2973976 RepID=UPI00216252CF|nr:O-antigen ligase family protein [Pseudarthrobacter sp. NS4]
MHQRLLTLAFVALGMGNLVLPAQFKAILPVDYLLLCLAIFAATMLFNLQRMVALRGVTSPIVYFGLSIVPGFFVGLVTTYGQSKLTAFLIFFLLLGAFAAAKEKAWISKTLVIYFAVVSLAICLLALTFGESGAGGRTILWDLNPIGIGRATGLLGTVCLTALLVSRKRNISFRILMLCGATLSFALTVSTGSRGPLLSAGLACVVAYLSMIALDGLSRAKSSLLLGTTAVSVAAFVLLAGPENAGLVRIQEGGDSGRLSLLSETWRVVAEHPLGIGWGNYARHIHGFVSNDGILYPHNIFVEFLVEGGVFGLLGFTFLVVIGLRRAFRLCRSVRTYGLMMLALLVFSLANAQLSSDIVGNRMLWVFLAAAIIFGAPTKSNARNLRLHPTAEGEPFSRLSTP